MLLNGVTFTWFPPYMLVTVPTIVSSKEAVINSYPFPLPVTLTKSPISKDPVVTGEKVNVCLFLKESKYVFIAGKA